jgi:hypothetical protein
LIQKKFTPISHRKQVVGGPLKCLLIAAYFISQIVTDPTAILLY